MSVSEEKEGQETSFSMKSSLLAKEDQEINIPAVQEGGLSSKALPRVLSTRIIVSSGASNIINKESKEENSNCEFKCQNKLSNLVGTKNKRPNKVKDKGRRP